MANELLMAYSALNESYQSGLVKKIEGPAATDTDTVAQINNPDETYVPLGPKESDPKLFSYAYGQDPAVLVARVTTDLSTQISSCKYTLTAPDAGGGKAWKVLARDVVLQSGGGNVATNPFGVAQVGTMLYLIDYASKKIYPLGVNELNGLPAGNYTLAYPPFDLGLSTTANLPVNAKGQAIAALKNGSTTYLYALYTVSNNTTYPPVFSPSVLVRLQVVPVTTANPYGLTYVDQVELALNAQELIYVTDFGGNQALLIPSIGGAQNPGATNGTASMIQSVDPFAASLSASTRITGDPNGTAGSYDIRAVAARSGDEGPAYILTGTFNANYNQNWVLYHCSVGDIMGMTGRTLSQEVSSGKLVVEDSDTGSPGSYWDIYYETGTGGTGTGTGTRLWFLRGSPIRISDGANYSSYKLFDTGYGTGDIGGINVDSAVLIAETMRQAALGVSYKRGLRGAPAPVEAEEEK